MRSQGMGQLAAAILAMAFSGTALAWMVWRAVLGLITLGDLALFYQAFNRGQGLMRALLLEVGQIYSNSLFLGNLFEFLDMQPRVVDPPAPKPALAALRDGIHFRDVTFRYPGSERVALSGFNLFIPAGQMVAIVGANGAGKSTLVKLLCRFYDPDAGAIEFDRIDIRDLALDDLRRLSSVLFQTPVQYQATAAENIALGDVAAASDAPTIEAAARGAGAHALITQLPHAYDSQLGKWFADGSELSGGEWQRVALARAFLRQAQLILLDEPTSFMDSWAEADWFERLKQLATGRTALIITHRFTIAMRADIIHVMHEGRIAESGSHDELLARDGLYAQSWFEQMRASSNALGLGVGSWESGVGEADIRGHSILSIENHGYSS
jgi:ATP-binding cassette subfamily B protein